jgi:hypothetical protein
MGGRENTVFPLPDISHSIWKASEGLQSRCSSGKMIFVEE